MGLETLSARVGVGELAKATLPCIPHWNQNHFVVLYKVRKGRKFYIADPGKGLITYGLEEFRRHWVSTASDGGEKGIAMFLEPTGAFHDAPREGVEGEVARLASWWDTCGSTASTSCRYSWACCWAACCNW